jgi:hypothetical protein
MHHCVELVSGVSIKQIIGHVTCEVMTHQHVKVLRDAQYGNV